MHSLLQHDDTLRLHLCVAPLHRLPGVVELCGTADDATNVYLVFEPCFGGDLYKRLAHQGLFDEAQLCKQVGVLTRSAAIV